MTTPPGSDTKEQMTASMPGAEDLVTRSRLLAFAVGKAHIEGLWLEFGVYKGKSLRKIAALTGQTVFGFDSFEGLPEDWVLTYRKGDFSLKGRLPEGLPKNVRLVKGEFSKSLPPFLSLHPEPVAFLHIDCDLYHSTRTVLTRLQNRITAGTVILFDEFHNYPGWQAHEYRAFMEFIDRSGYSFDYIGFASAYVSVAVRIVAA
jgi:hypothetical protein